MLLAQKAFTPCLQVGYRTNGIPFLRSIFSTTTNPTNLSAVRLYSSMSTQSRTRTSIIFTTSNLHYPFPTATKVLRSMTALQDRSFTSSTPLQHAGRPPLPPPRNPNNSRLAQGAGLVGAASLLFGKTKYIIAALKVTKLASLGSMVLTIGTYSMFFGLPYAAGMVGLILIHETGHALVMIRRNIPFSPMVFVPFMGAVIAMRQRPRDAWEDALVAFGGPALGSLGAVGVAVAAHSTDSQLLYALADFGFMINLFNLLPLGSMDGGRIAGALSKYAGVAGLGMGGVLAYSLPIVNPLFYLIMMAGGYETFQRFYNPADMPPNYYKISGTQRAVLTTGYFGLVGALVLAMGINGQNQKPPEVLMQERDMEKHWSDMHMEAR